MSEIATTIYDLLLLREIKGKADKRGCVIIPDTAKSERKKTIRFEVVAVGEGRLTPEGDIVPLRVKVGDIIAIGEYAGVDVIVDGETLVSTREEEIKAIYHITPDPKEEKTNA